MATALTDQSSGELGCGQSTRANVNGFDLLGTLPGRLSRHYYAHFIDEETGRRFNAMILGFLTHLSHKIRDYEPQVQALKRVQSDWTG